MRPYRFTFTGRNGTAKTSYLLDLDRVCAIGEPFFDEGDGLAYLEIFFSRGRDPMVTRFMTDYACTDPSVSAHDDRPMDVRKKIMADTKAAFESATGDLVAAWTGTRGRPSEDG